MNTTLITAATGAATSEAFTFANRDQKPNTIFATGLAGVETIDVQFTVDNGSTWADCYCNGSKVSLTATNNTLWLNVVGRFRLNKGVTAGAAGAVLVTEED